MSWDPSPTDARVERLPWSGSPLDLFRRLSAKRHPFLLLSGTASQGCGRWTILGCDPFLTWSLPGDAEGGEEPFAALAGLAARFPTCTAGALPFVGGLVGFLGYECRRFVEPVPTHPPDPGDPPDAWFAAYSAAILFDGASRDVWAVATGWPERDPGARGDRADREIEQLREIVSGAAPISRPPPPPTAGPLRSSLPRPRYLAAVRTILEHIRAGDIYQANLTQRLEVDLSEADPVDLFARLHRASAAPHAAFLDLGRWQLLSSSPERFVSLDGDGAESRPIKGTTRRGAHPEEDHRLREALRASPKDRAENLMIVDLVRNDLNRVCAPGTVEVSALGQIETYATLHHLVSTVRGRLDASQGPAELLRALFPPGSMTGAPKVRAMQILQEMEPVRRGPYAGGLGYLSFDGRMDLSVVIRTVILADGRARFHVGGGVVADSDPEAEYEESLLKARALRTVLGQC